VRTADSPNALARILIAPALIYIGAVIGVPFILSLWFAVSDVTVSSAAGNFVGLENFRSALDDPSFRRALRNTFLFAVVSQVIVVILATTLAVALQKDFKGKWVVRLLILLPWVAPVSLGSIGWLWILDSIYSVINYGLYHWVHVCGPEPGMTSCPVWLGQPSLAMASIIGVQVWRTLPLATVINLGGLSSIPQDIHDAASIDGAGFFRTMFQITIPLVLPILLVAVLFGFVFAFTDMIVVWVLTRGGPYDMTQVLASLAFFKGIDGGDLAGASAIALFLFPVLAAAAILPTERRSDNRVSRPATNSRMVEATRPTICAQTIARLCRNGNGAPGMAPRSTSASPKAASIGCWVERTEGSSTTEMISPNSVLGESRENAWRTPSAPRSSSAEVMLPAFTASASIGAKIGHRIVRNSQSPSVVKAAVAGERKMIENSMASASHTPA